MDLITPRLQLREFEGSDIGRPLPEGLGAKGPPIQGFDFRNPKSVRDQILSALESAKEEPRRSYDLAVVLKEPSSLNASHGKRWSGSSRIPARGIGAT